MNRDQILQLVSPKQFHLILMPTEDCNFRCTYCYEDYEIGKMSRETIDATKKLISKRMQTLQQFSLSWFGGEPLIAKDVVLEITKFALETAEKANVSFISDMTTNAYTMNEKTFKRLLDLNIRTYQISLDGDEDEHNRTRLLSTGKGTFTKIWNNLIGMKSINEDFSVLLRIHVHLENYSSVKKLLYKMQNEFGIDTRFSILLKKVGNWGGNGVKKMALIKDSTGGMDDLIYYLDEIGWNSYRESQLKQKTERKIISLSNLSADQKHNEYALSSISRNIVPLPVDEAKPIVACYAARPNSLVVRADGGLAKCTVAFNDPRNKIGKLNSDGTIDLEKEKMHVFMRGMQSMNESELRCPMQNMPKLPLVQPLQFMRKV